MRPIAGNKIFEALKDKDMIVMACNTRITKGVARGILKAAKKTDSAVIFELAKSESDLNGGYTGLTPELYAKHMIQASDEAGHDIWALHADHIGVKKGTPEEMKEVKELVSAQIKAGYTSFAIDASHLFNFQGKNVEEDLELNVKATAELALFIKSNMEGSFGLEAEVGEIGREDAQGRILTRPEEAVAFIKLLEKKNVHPNILAIANGSAHGNSFDAEGNLIDQVSIDIPQTIKVGAALKKAGLNIRIAQHGITGTPIDIIESKFPRQYIGKGNVGTHWMNIVWEVLMLKEPELYKEIWDWTLENHGIPGKKDAEVFGKNGKYAIKEFYDQIYSLSEKTEKAIENKAYDEALKFMHAFNSKGSAKIVRDHI